MPPSPPTPSSGSGTGVPKGVWYFFTVLSRRRSSPELNNIVDQLVVIFDEMRSYASTALGSVDGGPYDNQFMPYPWNPPRTTLPHQHPPSNCSARMLVAPAASCIASSCAGTNQPGTVSTAPSTGSATRPRRDDGSEYRTSERRQVYRRARRDGPGVEFWWGRSDIRFRSLRLQIVRACWGCLGFG